MTGYLLDTHVFFWVLQNSTNQVSRGFFAEVERWQQSGALFLSPITLWEMGLLDADGKFPLPLSPYALWEEATRDGAISVLPLTPAVLFASTRLPGTLHRDPADRILIATARDLNLTLVTSDKLLLAYAKQGHVHARKP